MNHLKTIAFLSFWGLLYCLMFLSVFNQTLTIDKHRDKTVRTRHISPLKSCQK
jgi:hypothetical protein